MHRVNGFASVGRHWLQNGVRQRGQASRGFASGQGSSQSSKVAIAGLAAVVAGTGIAHATGYINAPWRSSNDAQQPSKLIGSLQPISAKIPTIAATSHSADDTHQDQVKVKRKKKRVEKPATEAYSEEAPAANQAVSDSPASSEAALSVTDGAVSEASPAAELEAVPAKLEVAAEEADAALEVVAAAAAPAPEDAPAAAVEEASGDAAVEAPAPPEPKSAEYLLEPEVVDKIRELDLESEAENKILASILSEAVEESKKAVSSAVVHLVDASEMVKSYTILLKKALDDANPEKRSAWEEAVGMSLEKDRLLAVAKETYSAARNALTIALQAVEGGRRNPKTRDNADLIVVEEQIYRLRAEVDDRFLSLEKSQSDSRIMKAFTDLVEQGKQQFNAELKALMPDIKLNESGSKLSEAELNLLIAYAHRWIMQLQRQLAEYQLLEEQHLTDALDKQKAEDDIIAASKLREALAEQHGSLTLEKERQVSDVRKKAEEDLLAQLKRQAAAHSQHLREVLSVQEEDYNHRLKMILGEGIAVERRKLENLVREAFNQLKGIEAALDARAGTEVAARARQNLWIAVAALRAAVGMEHRVPLGDRVAAVSAAGGEDGLISVLLEAIPEEAKVAGVFSDANLKTRFEKVRDVCKRVSLVHENGGLWQTFLSYIKFKTTFESVLIKPAEELNAESDSMMQLICHAQWYVEHDDLESALRCMNQLRGEPRRTAFDWITEARAALETRQAVDALHAWVSVLNIGQFPPELKS